MELKRYLPLSIRIAIVLVALAIAMIFLAPQAIVIKTAEWIGRFVPALGLSLTVWFLTWSRRWGGYAFITCIALTLVSIYGVPRLAERREQARIDSELNGNMGSALATDALNEEALVQIIENHGMTIDRKRCLSGAYDSKRKICFDLNKEKFVPYSPNINGNWFIQE